MKMIWVAYNWFCSSICWRVRVRGMEGVTIKSQKISITQVIFKPKPKPIKSPKYQFNNIYPVWPVMCPISDHQTGRAIRFNFQNTRLEFTLRLLHKSLVLFSGFSVYSWWWCENMRGLRKSKRVSWPSELDLCQVVYINYLPKSITSNNHF